METAASGSSRDRVLTGAAPFGVVVPIGTLVFAGLIILAEQAGMPRSYSFLAAGIVMLAGIAVAAWQARTMSPSDWTVAHRSVSQMVNAAALAASLISGLALSLVAGWFFAGSPLAAVWVAGPLAGIAISAFIIAPSLRRSGATNPAELIALRFESGMVAAAFAFMTGLCGVLLLWAHLSAAGTLGQMLFPVDRRIAIVAYAALVALVVAPGGLRGVIRVNAIIFVFLATAYLAPLIWISFDLGAFPLPHLSYGSAALNEIGSIEAQLSSLGFARFTSQVDGVAAIAHPATAAIVLCLFLAGGICAMPFVLGHVPATRGTGSTRVMAGWAIVFAALVLCAAPALAAFAKLWLYRNMLGLTVEEITQGARWLLDWGSHDAVSAPVAMARLCGQAVSELSQAIAACGGNPDYVIGPADIRFAPEAVTMAVAGIVGMPAVFGGLVNAAVVATAIASANAVAFSIGVAVSRSLAGHAGGRDALSSIMLFRGRLALCGALAVSSFMALYSDVPPLEALTWGFGIAAAIIAPVLIGAIWWSRMNRWGALGGLAAGGLVLAAQAAANAFVPAGTGFAVPGLEGLPDAANAAAIALPVTVLAMVAVTFATKKQDNEKAMAAMHRPEAEPMVRGPEI